ncbi:MAG: hypothetical protein ABI411_13995 [Tahibacter sp.]
MQSGTLGSWRFIKHAGLCSVIAPGGIQIAASGGAPGSGVAGADAFGVEDATSPDGATVQHMRFGFRSGGFFTAEPDAHLAIGVAGRWRKDNPSTPSFDGCLMGRGIIIGNVSGAPQGCPQAPVVQIESFRRDGNALFATTCSPRLQDDVDYEITLWADVHGAIGYRVCNASKEPLAECRVNDHGANIPAGLGGWWITHVFSDSHPDADWTLAFVDLSIWWE